MTRYKYAVVLHWTSGEPEFQTLNVALFTRRTRRFTPPELAALVELCRRTS